MSIILFAVFFLYADMTLCARTLFLSGQVKDDVTLRGDTVMITGPVIIADSVTMVVLEGTVIAVGGSFGITVRGRLCALGTQEKPVIFTSARKLTGWQGIRFENISSSNMQSQLRYCTIENCIILSDSCSAVAIYKSKNIIVTNCIIRNCVTQLQNGRGSAFLCVQSSEVHLFGNRVEYAVCAEGPLFVDRSTVTIRSSAIQNNKAVTGSGGGIMVTGGSNVLIERCSVATNSASILGGAIYASGSNLEIRNSFILHNKASYGGGIYLESSMPGASTRCLLVGSCVEDNSSQFDGAAMQLTWNSFLVMLNTTIVHNRSIGNKAIIHSDLDSGLQIQNCIVWNNYGPAFNSPDLRSITFCAVQGGYAGIGNSDAYPCFIDSSGGNWALSAFSPCINGGSPHIPDTVGQTDITGAKRIFQDVRIDIGAYEYAGWPKNVSFGVSPTRIDTMYDRSIGLTVTVTVSNTGLLDCRIDSVRLLDTAPFSMVTTIADSTVLHSMQQEKIVLSIRPEYLTNADDSLVVYQAGQPWAVPIVCKSWGTVVPKGAAQGTWTREKSPFLLADTVTVADTAVLTIEPGVKVVMTGAGCLKVAGSLKAIGTATDSIVFTSEKSKNCYTRSALIFQGNAAKIDSSLLDYCIVELAAVDYTGRGAVIIEAYNTVVLRHCRLMAQRYNRYVISCTDASPVVNNSLISGSWVTCFSLKNSDMIIENNRFFSSTFYAAVRCDGGAALIKGNTFNSFGTAVMCLGAASRIIGNTIVSPDERRETVKPVKDFEGHFSQSDGVGIDCRGNSTLHIAANSITNYTAGIVCSDSTSVHIESNVISRNRQSGISCANRSSVVSLHNTVFNNSFGLKADDSTRVVILNSIFWYNSVRQLEGKKLDVSYCAIQGGYPADHILTIAPCFDTINGSLQNNSPCINTGSDRVLSLLKDSADIARQPRLFGTAFDIGAFELQQPVDDKPIANLLPAIIDTFVGYEEKIMGHSVLLNFGKLPLIIDSVRLVKSDYWRIDSSVLKITRIEPLQAETLTVHFSCPVVGVVYDTLLLSTNCGRLQVPLSAHVSTAKTIIRTETVSGELSRSGSPYAVTATVVIPRDSVLVIEQGVRIMFLDSTGLTVSGNLKAVGTQTEPIVLTSYRDPGSSDSAMVPWSGIFFKEYSGVASTADSSLLQWVDIDKVVDNAVVVMNRATLRLEQVAIRDATTAIRCSRSGCIIRNCRLTGNGDKERGAAIVFEKYSSGTAIDSLMVIENCVMNGFFAGIIGRKRTSGLMKVRVVNSVIAANHGNGLEFEEGYSADIINTTIAYNQDKGLYAPNQMQVRLLNDIVWGNLYGQVSARRALVAFSTIAGGYPGEGNSAHNPCFVNYLQNDFRLANYSSCINRGRLDTSDLALPPTDADGKSRIYQAVRIDRGAYEFPGFPLDKSLDFWPQRLDTLHRVDDTTGLICTVFNGTNATVLLDSIKLRIAGVFSIKNQLPPQTALACGQSYPIEVICFAADTGLYIDTLSLVYGAQTASIPISVRSCKTLIHGGDVSGRWQRFSSPYSIAGDIMVPAGRTLLIEPGVTIQFLGRYSLTVEGTISAIGNTAAGPITFYSPDSTRGWKGIRIIGKDEATDSCFLVLCRIERCRISLVEDVRHSMTGFETGSDMYGALLIKDREKVRVSDCVIRNNAMARFGGAVACIGSSRPLIQSNTISHNTTEYGGAVFCANTSAAVIIGNRFCDNWAFADGGGVFCRDSSTAFVGNNYFTRNWALIYGGAIADRSVRRTRIEGNRITSNSANTGGGGLFCSCSSSVVNNCIDSNSIEGSSGGAMYVQESDRLMIVANNTIVGNKHGAVRGSANLILVNCILWGNTDSIETLPGYTTYFCVVEGGSTNNGCIVKPPLFLGGTAHPFRLTMESPCIDRGYYNSVELDLPQHDAAGRRRIKGLSVDIGAYEYVNDPPQIRKPVGDTVCFQQALMVRTLSAADPDSGDTMVWFLSEKPRTMKIDSITGVLSWVPVASDVGEHRIIARVKDCGGLSDSVHFLITVKKVTSIADTLPSQNTTLSRFVFVSQNPVSRLRRSVDFYTTHASVDGGFITILDPLGSIVNQQRCRISEQKNGYSFIAAWDLRDRTGRKVAAGTYAVFVQLRRKNGDVRKALMLLGVQ
ncbi:MAG: right-handed parallel beta-helix repeat-containing protein [Chitinivibrionales bacterium]|nr:right-handed parallel beta-helix repeat-containing protein [Chitinivibrionales bacterium]